MHHPRTALLTFICTAALTSSHAPAVFAESLYQNRQADDGCRPDESKSLVCAAYCKVWRAGQTKIINRNDLTLANAKESEGYDAYLSLHHSWWTNSPYNQVDKLEQKKYATTSELRKLLSIKPAQEGHSWRCEVYDPAAILWNRLPESFGGSGTFKLEWVVE